MKKVFTYLVLMLVGFSSCNQELDLEFMSDDFKELIGNGEVLVPLSIESFGSIDTRSSVSPSEDKISNYSVFIYQKGKLARDLYTDSNTNSSVVLHIGQTYNVYVLANTGDLIAPEDESSLQDFAYNTVGMPSLAAEIPMAQNYGEVTVSPSTCLNFVVTRLVSRISFSLDALPVKGMKVTSVKLCNAPYKVYPFAKGGSKAGRYDVADGDYATAADITSLNKGGNVVFYVFENMQGTLLSENTDPWKKTPDSIGSSNACTYIEAVCSFTQSIDGREGTVIYRMYLGKDNITNFDIVRNTLMSVSIVTSEESLDQVSWKVTPDYVQHVTSLTLDHDDLVLEIGNTGQLTATVLPDDAFDKSVLWESSDPKVVSVDGNGKLTPLKVGNCVITARSNDNRDVYDQCNVTVNKVEYELEITPAAATIDVGASKSFELKYYKIVNDVKGAGSVVTSLATWETEKGFVTVVKGLVKGVSAGTDTITASYGGLSISATVTVKDVITYNYRFFISGYNSVIAGQDTEPYKLYYYKDTYTNGALTSEGNSPILYSGSVNWSVSSGASYGKVSSAGVLTGLAKGSVTVRAYVVFDGSEYECFKDVTVTQASSGGPDTGWEDGGDVDYN